MQRGPELNPQALKGQGENPFTNPVIVSKFPFHCHILEHQDGGMMLNLRVRAP